ncbi:hypothetical protein GC173_08430 [bacterium]|nr:hypothetical protein [bacterium]
MIHVTRRRPHWVLVVIGMLAGPPLGLLGCVSYEKKPLSLTEFAERQQKQQLAAEGSTAAEPRRIVECAEAEKLALLLNPALQSARLEAGVATATASEAGRWLDPRIGADALRVIDPEPGDSGRLYGASLTFTIPISGRFAVEKSGAKAAQRAALVRVWAAEQALVRDVRVAWAGLIAARDSAVAAQEYRDEAVALAAQAERLAAAGEIAPSEAAAYRMAAIQHELVRKEREASLMNAEREMLRLTGVSSRVTFEPSESAPATEATAWSMDSLVQRNPSVLVAEAEYAVAEEQLRLAIREQYPDVELGPLYEREGGKNRLGLGFSLPIPILNGNRQAIAERKAEREVARSRWEEEIVDSASQVAALSQRVEVLAERLRTIRGELLPFARKRLEETRSLQGMDEAGPLLVLDALEGLEDARIAEAEARRELEEAVAALRHALPDEPYPTTSETEASRK